MCIALLQGIPMGPGVAWQISGEVQPLQGGIPVNPLKDDGFTVLRWFNMVWHGLTWFNHGLTMFSHLKCWKSQSNVHDTLGFKC